MKILSYIFILCVLLLALACGGGASGGGSSEKVSIKIDMVYPESSRGKASDVRSKFAILDANTPFRIGTDAIEFTANPPGDPVHATQVRARFFQSGNVVAEASQDVIRYTTDPSVDPASRRIVMRGVPTGVDLSLLLDLGRNFGEIDYPYQEAIYYSANVQNIIIGSSNVIVGGNVQSSIKAPLRTNSNGQFYQMQCFVDLSSLPVLPRQVLEKPADARISLNAIPNTVFAKPAVSGLQLVSDNILDFQSYFFEIFDISVANNKFDLIIESGGNINMMLGGMILPDEASVGLPLVFDFETSYIRILSLLHEDPIYGRPSGNIQGVYRAIEKAYAAANVIMSASGNTNIPMEVRAQDLALMHVGYELAKMCNNGDEFSRFRYNDPAKFQTEVITVMGSTASASVDFFLFSGGKNVPLKVNFDSNAQIQTPLLILGSINGDLVDASGNYISAQNNNLGSGNTTLSELFNTRIVTPYYNTPAIWDYIESFTNLKTLSSDNVN
jgi:hypothetical protein